MRVMKCLVGSAILAATAAFIGALGCGASDGDGGPESSDSNALTLPPGTPTLPAPTVFPIPLPPVPINACRFEPPTAPRSDCVVPTVNGRVFEYVVTTYSGACKDLTAPHGKWLASSLGPSCNNGDGGLKAPLGNAMPPFSLPSCLYQYIAEGANHPSDPPDANGLCTCDTAQISAIPDLNWSGAANCPCCYKE